jgi:hypothetical protein
MKSLSDVLCESQITGIEEVAKLIKPYVKQWYKYHQDDSNWPDDLEPVKNIKDGITRMGSRYDSGEWDVLEFELKCGETGRIQHQLTDGIRSKVSFINGFIIYLDSSDGPFDGYKFRYMSSPNLKSAIEHIKRLSKGK